MRTLGLIGGMSWESTAIYYRHLNELARERLGGLHSARLLLWSFDFAEVAKLQHGGDWDAAGADPGRRGQPPRARRRRGAGPLHQHHAQAGRHLRQRSASRCCISPTRPPPRSRRRMPPAGPAGHPLHHGAAVLHGPAARPARARTVVPGEAGRELVHGIIYEELCRGVVRARSRRRPASPRSNGCDRTVPTASSSAAPSSAC